MKLKIEDFLSQSSSIPIIDVRTPAEFAQGHIPGAHNIPLLSNEERAVVGTMYKHQGKEPAFEKALEYAGPNMVDYVRKAKKINNDSRLLVYCWRGGMRSGSMAWLFNQAGIESHTLEGGYRAFRRHIHSKFENAKKIIVLGGYTGSGKTDILKEMKNKCQVIDLEGLAHHKGSAFGFIGQSEQPTTEQFENNLGMEWLKLDNDNEIWLEDESRNIGKVYLPDNLYSKIRNSILIFLEMPKAIRIQRLVKEYSKYDDEMIAFALNKIKKRIGGLNYNDALDALDKKDYNKIADISLTYYDKAYLYGMNKRDHKKIFKIIIEEDNPKMTFQTILKFFNSINNKKTS